MFSSTAQILTTGLARRTGLFAVAGAAAAASAVATISCAAPSSTESTPLNEKDKRIAVFCGSALPKTEGAKRIAAATEKLAAALVQNGVELVYGGGNVGLMGVVSSTVDRKGGVVRGVIPKALHNFELVTLGAQPQNLTVVDTMHERKALMAKLSCAFIALPGGFGTFEELLEAITWTQLAVHDKPVGVLNVDGFYDPLIAQVDKAVEMGFIQPQFRDILVVESDPEKLVQRLLSYKPPAGYKLTWTNKEDDM